MSPPRLPPALLALSPGDLVAGRTEAFLQRLGAALACGLRGVLLREPRLSDRDWLALARRVRRALDELDELDEESRSGWLGAHDRAHLAQACGADGVHVGGRSLGPAELRGWLDPRLAIGLSTHAGDDPSAWAGADYLVHGPVHAVPGKGPPIGLAGLRRAVQASARPLWALGGLGPQHAGELLACGARGLAVLRGVLGAPDPGPAARRYLDALRRAPRGAGH